MTQPALSRRIAALEHDLGVALLVRGARGVALTEAGTKLAQGAPPVLRLAEMPRVELHLVPGGEKPTGVGEPGTPPVAPAVANALFALTGKRARLLPLDDIKWG